MLEWRLKAFRNWLTIRSRLGQRPLPADRLPDMIYYSAPKLKKQPKSLEEIDPELLRPTRSWDPWPSSSGCPAWAVDPCSTAYRWPPPSGEAPGAGDHLLLVLRGGAGAPRPGAAVPGSVVPYNDNSSRRSIGRCSATARSPTSEGCALPDVSSAPTSGSTRRYRQFERP